MAFIMLIAATQIKIQIGMLIANPISAALKNFILPSSFLFTLKNYIFYEAIGVPKYIFYE